MFRLFSLRKWKKQKMEEEQRERELVYEEMVRKYFIIVYLYLDTLFIFLIIVPRNETRLFYIKTIFSILLQHFRLFYIK